MGAKGKMIELNRRVSDINMKRAYLSSVLLSISVPVSVIAACIGNWSGVFARNTYIIVAGLMEVFQLLFMFVLRKQYSLDEFDRFHAIYTAYFYVTFVFLMFGAVCDIAQSGSILFYLAACVYIVFIPAFTKAECIGILIFQTVAVILLSIVSRMDLRMSFDVCIIQAATILLVAYQHNLAVQRVRVSMQLKRKTDYSEHDALTGLYNRRGLDSRINAIWPFCERNRLSVAMIAIDVDYFKKYNDTFGHPKGDECLRSVADVLKNSAQRSTDVVTRTGGEEFIVFVQDMDEGSLISLAMKIRNNLDQKHIEHAYYGVSKYVTVSMGIAGFVPAYNNDFKKLYQEADNALYLAKKNGRNCIVYDGKVYGSIMNGASRVASI